MSLEICELKLLGHGEIKEKIVCWSLLFLPPLHHHSHSLTGSTRAQHPPPASLSLCLIFREAETSRSSRTDPPRHLTRRRSCPIGENVRTELTADSEQAWNCVSNERMATSGRHVAYVYRTRRTPLLQHQDVLSFVVPHTSLCGGGRFCCSRNGLRGFSFDAALLPPLLIFAISSWDCMYPRPHFLQLTAAVTLCSEACRPKAFYSSTL